MELAAAGHLKLIWAVALLNPQCDVVDELSLKALLDVTRRDVLSLTTRKGRVVYLKSHTHGGLVNG